MRHVLSLTRREVLSVSSKDEAKAVFRRLLTDLERRRYVSVTT